MKVALVSLNVRYIHKNLALRWLYVAKPAAIDAKIIEGTVADVEGCVQQIVDYRPNVLGLSCFIFNVDATRALISRIKTLMPDLKIYCGGPEATYHSERFWDLPISGILRGEAEFDFWKAIQGQSAPGLQSRPDESPAITRVDLSALESLESPYFLPFDQADRLKRYLYVETSRGCPYGCTYCMASLDRQVRTFSLPYLKDFFDRLKEEPVSQVKFLDRTFNLHPDRAMILAKACLSVPKPTTFHVELVGDTLSTAFKDLIKANVDRFRMEIGVQSFHEPTLKAVGRTCSIPKLKETIAEFSAAGAHQHTDLIAGLPYEDLNTLKDSLAQMVLLHPKEIQFGILKLLKGSALYQDIEAYEYSFDAQAPYQVRSNRWLSAQDLVRIEAAALAMEKCYNSGRLRPELQIYFNRHAPNAFDVLADIGQQLKTLIHPYSVRDFHLAVVEGFKAHDPQASQRIEAAYYRNAKLKPPRLFPKTDIPHLTQITQRLTQIDVKLERLNAIYLASSGGIDAWFYLPNETRLYQLTPQGDLVHHETYPRHA